MKNPYLNLSKEEIQKKIDALKAQQLKEKQPSSQDNPYLNLSREEIEEKINQIKMQQEEMQSSQDPTFSDRFKQFGKGALHGAYETAKFLQPSPTSSDPFLFPFEQIAPSFEDPEKINEKYSQYEQQHEDELKNTDSLGRILNNAGSFAGSMIAPIPLGGVGNALKQGYKAIRHKTPVNLAQLSEKFAPNTFTSNSFKNALKTISGASGLGATSGVAQEMGVDPLVADIGAIAGAPFVASLAKKVPTAAKLAFSEKNRALAKEDKISKDIGKKFLEEEGVTPESINVSHNANPFQNRLDSEITGGRIKEGISKVLENLNNIRTQKTKPLYDAARAEKDLVVPKNMIEFIDNEMPFLTETFINDLKKIKKEALGEAIETEAGKISKHDKTLGITKKTSPLEADFLRKYGGNQPEEGSLLPKLDTLYSEIGDEISNAKASQKQTKAKIFKSLQEKLKQDFSEHPLGNKRHEIYRETSKPINKIEKSILGALIKSKDPYGLEAVIKDESVMKRFLKGNSALDSSRKLKEVVGEDKKIMDSIKSSINDDFIKKTFDNSKEKYNISSIQTYLRDHPGVEILYPEFKGNAQKLMESQKLSEKLRKLSEDVDFIKDSPASSVAIRKIKKSVRNLPLGDKLWDMSEAFLNNPKKKEQTIDKIVDLMLTDTEAADRIFKSLNAPKKNFLEGFAKYSKGTIPSLKKNEDSNSKK